MLSFGYVLIHCLSKNFTQEYMEIVRQGEKRIFRKDNPLICMVANEGEYGESRINNEYNSLSINGGNHHQA